MVTDAAVRSFLEERTLAVVGVSRKPTKFGNMVYRSLKAKGYRVFPVNPQAETIDGDRCFPNLAALPERVNAVLVVVPSALAEGVVREAAAAGMRKVWLQRGVRSPSAIAFAEQQGLSVVRDYCILMFAEPAEFFHRAHRWVVRLVGGLPRRASA